MTKSIMPIIGFIAIIVILSLFLILFRKSPKTGTSVANMLGEKINHLVSKEVECVYFSDVVDWIKKRQNFKQASADNIAFSLLKKRDDGKYELVVGIFNKKPVELIAGKKLIALRVDPELEKTHCDKELVLYE